MTQLSLFMWNNGAGVTLTDADFLCGYQRSDAINSSCSVWLSSNFPHCVSAASHSVTEGKGNRAVVRISKTRGRMFASAVAWAYSEVWGFALSMVQGQSPGQGAAESLFCLGRLKDGQICSLNFQMIKYKPSETEHIFCHALCWQQTYYTSITVCSV